MTLDLNAVIVVVVLIFTLTIQYKTSHAQDGVPEKHFCGRNMEISILLFNQAHTTLRYLIMRI